MAEQFDAIVIGGGHNGLVCATYLARGGRKVLVLEAAAEIGGAAITREFAPGYRVSAAAHLLHMMPEALMRELDLAKHGLSFAATDLPTVSLGASGEHVVMSNGKLSSDEADAAAYTNLVTRLKTFARLLAQTFDAPPPRLASGDRRDLWSLAKLGLKLRLLGKRDMREFLRIIGMNVHDLVEEKFTSDLLKGALGFEAVMGSATGPRTPGTVLSLLYRLTGSGFALPRGGMGAVTTALANAAKAAGVEIRVNARVARIVVEQDRASRVVLESGETIAAKSVISNADPKTTFLKLLGPEHLDTGFVRSVSHIRMRGNAAKLHLALSAAPAFAGLPSALHGSRLLIAPSLAYVEHAYNASKYEEASVAPAIELIVPSLNDDSLAPAGCHVLSAVVQFAPYGVKGGWEAEREAFTARIVDQIEAVAPGTRKLIVASELLTPPDLESQFGLGGGHWHHGEIAFDQFFMVRPVPGAAQYHTPINGLYLCGAGCHPGGGVMGLAGRNAARQVLRGAV